MQTADASPNGGHWLECLLFTPLRYSDIVPSFSSEFDEKDFVTGVQLLTDNYAAVLSGDATLNGVTVTNVSQFNSSTFDRLILV